MEKKERLSNFELMRIMSMFLIVTGHVFSWGGIMSVSDYRVSMAINFIYAIILVHVNSFILLTGFFQSKSKFRISKIIKLFLLMCLYKAVLVFICYKMSWIELTKFELLWNMSPFDFSNYWFLKLYIVLYFISPFLNHILDTLSKTVVKRMIKIIFLFCSCLVTVTNQELFNNSRGFSLVHFVFIYIIGFYIRKFIVETPFFEELKKNKRKKYVNLYLFFSIFVFCFLINYILYRIGYKMILYNNSTLSFFGNRIIGSFMGYDNPLVVIGSVAYFMFFSILNIKSKFINSVSVCIFEVYIIHETVLFRKPLYSFFNIVGPYTSYRILIKAFLIILIILVSCILIAFIRKQILKLLIFVSSKIRFINILGNKIKTIESRIDSYMNI